jgi:hypothetical protein
MKNILVALAVLSLSASPAGAQSLSLHPGETVTVRLEGVKTIVERSGPAEPISNYEIYALWRAETQQVPPGVRVVPPGLIMQGEGPPDPPHPTDNRLQLTMRRVPGAKPGWADGTVLFIANGYGSLFAYRAMMSAKGRAAATDVCEVPPNLLGLEYWPYAIEQLDLSDLRLEPPINAIRCG